MEAPGNGLLLLSKTLSVIVSDEIVISNKKIKLARSPPFVRNEYLFVGSNQVKLSHHIASIQIRLLAR